jgi:hypothetical protein
VFPTVVVDDVGSVTSSHTGKRDGLTTETAERWPQRRLERTSLSDTLEEARTGWAVAGVYFANWRIQHLDGGLVLELAAALRTGE